MPELSIPVLYRTGEVVNIEETVESFIKANPQIGQFVSDWGVVQQLLTQKGELKDAEFPSELEHVSQFVVNSTSSNKVGIGPNQTMNVRVVPGHYDDGEVKQFLHEDQVFSVDAPMLFRPEPIETDISRIFVREMEDDSAIKPPTLRQYMENKAIDLKGLDSIDVYTAVLFVPISSSEDEGRRYTTQVMVQASSSGSQWYKPILQGKAHGGPIVNESHDEYEIDMIGANNKGKYWQVNPIDLFGEAASEIFGDDTGRLVIVSVPQVAPPQVLSLRSTRGYGDTLGVENGEAMLSSYGMTPTNITAGGDTGRNYRRGHVEIDVNRGMQALSILTIGVRPETTQELSLEKILPGLVTGK